MVSVSVIIPNYNHSRYLAKRLQSVLDQTYRDFEIILLDDCSTDNSRAVIEPFRGHENVRHIVYNEQNSGSTFRQWKKGMDLATGHWIWIAESDDFCREDFLEVLLADAIPEPYGLRYSASTPVDENGTVLPRTDDIPAPGAWDGKTFLLTYLLQYNKIPNASAVLIKKELLQRVLTPEIYSLKLTGDWLVWCKLALCTSFFYTTHTVNYHRQHAQTVRNTFNKKGILFAQYRRFRQALTIHLRQLPESTIKKKLLVHNNRIARHETGLRGFERIRNKQYISGFMLALQAAIRNGNLGYVKDALYWTVKTSGIKK